MTTLAEARAQLRRVGVTLRKTEHDEYRVAFAGRGSEASAAYESDVDAAVATGRAMARNRSAAPVCPGCGWPVDAGSKTTRCKLGRGCFCGNLARCAECGSDVAFVDGEPIRHYRENDARLCDGSPEPRTWRVKLRRTTVEEVEVEVVARGRLDAYGQAGDGAEEFDRNKDCEISVDVVGAEESAT